VLDATGPEPIGLAPSQPAEPSAPNPVTVVAGEAKPTPTPQSPFKGLPKPLPRPSGAAKPEPLPPEIPSIERGLLASIQLRASSALQMGEVTASGKRVFRFRVWVDAPATTAEQIKSVEYFFDHPSFVNNTFTSATAPRFEQGYSGWGCITTVQVTIRWKSGRVDKRPFDQCAAL
jgi:hypothetical protein